MVKEHSTGIIRRTMTAVMAAAILATCSAVSVFADEYTQEGEYYPDNGYVTEQPAEEQPAEEQQPAEQQENTGLVETPAEDETTKADTGLISDSPAVTDEKEEIDLPAVTLRGEIKFNNGNTHPWNYQTSRLRVRWNKVDGAARYQIWCKGGKYTEWTKIKTLLSNHSYYTVKNLDRDTEYSFKVRATVPGHCGPFSEVQTLKTARMDFDEAGWQAMCRIVYHEVGGVNDPMWDEPIVHVADCIVNQYEAAKYLNHPTWAPYYRRYSNIQSIIYQSGGFMSDWGLTRDGATYDRTTTKVRNAVYGAVYDKIKVNKIAHDRNVFFWCNTYYRPTGYKVGYTYRIPWGGWFSIWREYWG